VQAAHKAHDAEVAQQEETASATATAVAEEAPAADAPAEETPETTEGE
jgi:hypothetical protein